MIADFEVTKSLKKYTLLIVTYKENTKLSMKSKFNGREDISKIRFEFQLKKKCPTVLQNI